MNMAKYKFDSSDTQLLNRLRKSLAVKIKQGYSKNVSPGFIAGDLQEIYQDIDGDIIIVTEAFRQKMPMCGLNVRETQEAIKFEQIKIAKDKLKEVTE
jgi:uncharacterized protein (UPF0210 family)